MSETWLWYGDYDRLEHVMPGNGAKPASRARADSPFRRYGHWSEVGPGDAVFSLSEHKAVDEQRFPGAWILNSRSAAAALMPQETQQLIWQRSGLMQQERGYVRLYLIRVVHLDPIEMIRLDSSGNPVSGTNPLSKSGSAQAAPGSLWPQDAAVRRVVRTAVRALYVLGLDVGEVEVALGMDGKTSVRAVHAMEDIQLRQASLQRFAGWLHTVRSQEYEEEKPPLLIGADPEFLLLRPDGKVASAARFLGESTGAAAGTDVLRVGRRLLYPVAELRPDPADNPNALAANVRLLLLRAAKRIGSDYSLRWAAGAMPARGIALGGHIHFSGVPLTSKLLHLLDSYTAFILAMVEDPSGRGRRPRYGALGDFRLQPHGFEYRTLPSWLVSPAAAKGAFALSLLCAKEAWNLSYLPSMDERFIAAYYEGDRAELLGCLDGLAAEMAATESYGQYAAYIEPLLDAARKGAVWDESQDIRFKWRIPPLG
ncbi:putative amidoligase domain-containing protein [Paenibacillus protaetiae]|uniref:PhiEco32-like amidoligase-type 2 protein n=1 Tax=Paenibacillus protaetiae TaxID=2509456 RepID=A0A4P6ESX3_9BACL|nr:hypothetical protein [Paenibacillus protaetiae]QAY66062.1 hypothetical protein ET464_06330 [Paenibacillus protaetiae]